MVDLGLLKSGKVELQSTIDRGNLRVFLGMHCKKLTLIVRNLFSAETRTLQGTESWFTIERWNLCQCISKNRLILKIYHGQWSSRICEQSQRPSAKQTEKNVEYCRVMWRTFNNMGNVHGYDIKCSDIHGKESLNHSKCCQESWKSYLETDVRSTLAISVPSIVLKWCRKERKKKQVKKESQQNRSRWWIWSRDAAKGLLTCLLLLHQKARWTPDMKVNYLWAHVMSSKQGRGDPLYTHTHQATQNGTLIRLGLLKSGNLVICRTQVRGDPYMTSLS